MAQIRQASLHDMPALYRICLQTGDSGRDATRLYRDPDLLGHVFVGPYLVGQPELAFVAQDDQGVVGYVLGAADTAAFEAWAEKHWWPPLRARYPTEPATTRDAELIARDAELIAAIHVRRPPSPELVRDYPAHLHIDLLPRGQGTGLGRALMERLLAELKSRGCAGVHLGVGRDNPGAVGFYRHLGFTTLKEGELGLLLGLRLR